MKKLFVIIALFTVALILSKASFTQVEEASIEADTSTVHVHAEPVHVHVEATVDEPIGVARSLPVPQVLPFGYPPYPAVGGYPAFGAPYSYPRGIRRTGRFAQPAMPSYPVQAQPLFLKRVPPLQETLATTPPVETPQGEPTIFYRPTPIRNFFTLIASPRPYIGYDPYAGYPPFPGYIPPQ